MCLAYSRQTRFHASSSVHAYTYCFISSHSKRIKSLQSVLNCMKRTVKLLLNSSFEKLRIKFVMVSGNGNVSQKIRRKCKQPSIAEARERCPTSTSILFVHYLKGTNRPDLIGPRVVSLEALVSSFKFWSAYYPNLSNYQCLGRSASIFVSPEL